MRNPFSPKPLVSLLEAQVDHYRRVMFQAKLDEIDARFKIQACEEKISFLYQKSQYLTLNKGERDGK